MLRREFLRSVLIASGGFAAGLGFRRRLRIVVDGVGVADRSREHHDVCRFDGEGEFGQGFPPTDMAGAACHD